MTTKKKNSVRGYFSDESDTIDAGLFRAIWQDIDVDTAHPDARNAGRNREYGNCMSSTLTYLGILLLEGEPEATAVKLVATIDHSVSPENFSYLHAALISKGDTLTDFTPAKQGDLEVLAEDQSYETLMKMLQEGSLNGRIEILLQRLKGRPELAARLGALGNNNNELARIILNTVRGQVEKNRNVKIDLAAVQAQINQRQAAVPKSIAGAA